MKFNLVFNSIDTYSYVGDVYNPQFYVDFATLQLTPEDYLKKYKVTFRFKTASDIDILPTFTHIIKLNINTRVSNQSNLQNDYTLGVLSKTLDNVVDGHLAFDTKPSDNPYVVFHGLDRMNRIGVRFEILETEGLFTDIPDYILILSFESIE